jgi:hypothetical protein
MPCFHGDSINAVAEKKRMQSRERMRVSEIKIQVAQGHDAMGVVLIFYPDYLK